MYAYGLGGSFNDFQIGKASKFYISMLLEDFRLCEQFAVGLSIFMTVGLESNNGLCKDQVFDWTNRNLFFSQSLLRQRLEVYTSELMNNNFKLYTDLSDEITVFNSAKVYDDFNIDDHKHETDARAKRFGAETACNGTCTVCNGLFSSDSVQPLELFATEGRFNCKGSEKLIAFLKQHKVNKLPLSYIFSKHLRMDLQKNLCLACTRIFLFLVALFQDKVNSLAWLK